VCGRCQRNLSPNVLLVLHSSLYIDGVHLSLFIPKSAVNGEDSADMLRLPNRKVFDYLKRQYSQQCSKLNEEVFDRKSWEAVMPEV